MIELVSESRCTGCNICVRVCPMNVFERVPGGIPVIARQDVCQTCFMCEAWCPEDALYVSPDAQAAQTVSEHALLEQGVLGSYRRNIGWTRQTEPLRAVDDSFLLVSVPQKK